MKASEILGATATYLKEVGWAQGTFLNARTGQACVEGAAATVLNESSHQACDFLHEHLWPVIVEQFTDFRPGMCPITSWNDTPGRSVDEVLMVLEKAAVRAREKEGFGDTGQALEEARDLVPASS